MTVDEIKASFESGDELYLIDKGDPTNCDAQSGSGNLLWTIDNNKNTSGLPNAVSAFIFIDDKGKLYTKNNVSFRIVRSGKRNMLGSAVAGITMMEYPVTGSGSNLKLIANSEFISGNKKVINASVMDYKERWQTDNDVIRKMAMVFNSSTCTETEVANCNGYLEKSINPYRKGLLGNFKTHRSLVFYGERNETNDPTIATNLLTDGFLKDFKSYWDFIDFDGKFYLTPDAANTKWVWNNQITRLNARGLELETKDALEIYTAAQYGFNKTLPVAIANNAKLDEIANEGFEDKSYDESVNTGVSTNSCIVPQIDFSTMGAIVPYMNAHSGKYVLGVNATASKNIGVRSTTSENYSLQYSATETDQFLFEFGQNLTSKTWWPANSLSNNSDFVQSSSTDDMLHLLFTPADEHTTTGKNHSFSVSYTYYIEVDESGNYPLTFDLAGTDHTDQVAINYSLTNLTHASAGTVSVYANNCFYTYPNTNCGSNSDYISQSIYLCKGRYRINLDITSQFSCLNSNPAPYDCSQISHYVDIKVFLPFQRYKSLTAQNGCVYTKPLPATDAMHNPTFSIPATKKMIFSAWVRESNTQVSTYTGNEVKLDFGSGNVTTLTPSGPIIEGWQRYEGYFTAPTGATSMNLKFVNNSGGTIYFDDIRIHPFNANMTSYVYDPVNLRLTAQLDANNYASFYEYDEEGTLIRTKAETKQGVKTITETRSFKQTSINQIQ